MRPASDLRPPPAAPARDNRRAEILRGLAPAASRVVNAQLDAFSARLSNALLAAAQASSDPELARNAQVAGALLKDNQYAFFHLASRHIEQAFLHELTALVRGVAAAPAPAATEGLQGLELVSYDEMDQKVSLGNACRPFENEHEAAYAALNGRLATLLQRDAVPLQQNPFRPEVLLNAILTSWNEFLPEDRATVALLPLLRPELFLELGPVLQVVNQALITHGIEPTSAAIRKTTAAHSAAKSVNSALSQQLRRMFAPDADTRSGSGTTERGAGGSAHEAAAERPQLFSMLSDLQRGAHIQINVTTGADATESGRVSLSHLSQLPQIRQQLPRGALSRVDETTFDLLTQVFDTVFANPSIPTEIKELIGVLQVPVLKAALIEKEFFFEQAHPARRLIEMLSQSSLGWDREKGRDDPLYQTIKRNVDRVQQNFDQEVSVFSDVLSDLENYIAADEAATAQVLDAPIAQALKTEKIRVATKVAEEEVAVRLADGEVATFVEAFLEQRWVPILALAHSVKEEKPELLQSAVSTMDELIWSVKPKATAAERKELISKLPALLASLNKWIKLMQWDDAERIQFFADLAECHASIVRAPLDLSPQRQVEVAVEAAKLAAEKRAARAARAAAKQPEPETDEYADTVASLERGIWLHFRQADGSDKQVKLAWVSPLRTLYIFTTSSKQENFSLSAEALAQALREQRAGIVEVDRVVERALNKAMESAEAGVEMVLETA